MCHCFSLIPSACFISGLFGWWAWSTKHARDPWDQKWLQKERSPRSRIYSMLLKQTPRGRPRALTHVTARRHSSSLDSIHKKLRCNATPPQDITLPHKSILCGFLFQHHPHKESINDRRHSKVTKTSLGNNMRLTNSPLLKQFQNWWICGHLLKAAVAVEGVADCFLRIQWSSAAAVWCVWAAAPSWTEENRIPHFCPWGSSRSGTKWVGAAWWWR